MIVHAIQTDVAAETSFYLEIFDVAIEQFFYQIIYDITHTLINSLSLILVKQIAMFHFSRKNASHL